MSRIAIISFQNRRFVKFTGKFGVKSEAEVHLDFKRTMPSHLKIMYFIPASAPPSCASTRRSPFATSAGEFTGYLKAGDNAFSQFCSLVFCTPQKMRKSESRNPLLSISEPLEFQSAHFPPPVPDLVEKARKISEHAMCV